MKKSYRITIPNAGGKNIVVKVSASCNADAIAAAQKFAGVGADVAHLSLRCEGPIDVSLAAGTGPRRIHHYGYDNKGGVRVLASSPEGTEEAARKHLGIAAGKDYDSYAVDEETIDIEA
jgi:hypothetical protein